MSMRLISTTIPREFRVYALGDNLIMELYGETRAIYGDIEGIKDAPFTDLTEYATGSAAYLQSALRAKFQSNPNVGVLQPFIIIPIALKHKQIQDVRGELLGYLPRFKWWQKLTRAKAIVWFMRSNSEKVLRDMPDDVVLQCLFPSDDRAHENDPGFTEFLSETVRP